MFKLLALLLGTAHAGTYMDIHGSEQTLLTTSGALHEFTGSLGPGANLMFADLMFADLNGADLNGANLNGAQLQYANLEHTDLEGADLSGASFGAFVFGSDITVEGGLIQCPASRQELRSAMNDKSC